MKYALSVTTIVLVSVLPQLALALDKNMNFSDADNAFKSSARAFLEAEGIGTGSAIGSPELDKMLGEPKCQHLGEVAQITYSSLREGMDIQFATETDRKSPNPTGVQAYIAAREDFVGSGPTASVEAQTMSDIGVICNVALDEIITELTK